MFHIISVSIIYQKVSLRNVTYVVKVQKNSILKMFYFSIVYSVLQEKCVGCKNSFLINKTILFTLIYQKLFKVSTYSIQFPLNFQVMRTEYYVYKYYFYHFHMKMGQKCLYNNFNRSSAEQYAKNYNRLSPVNQAAKAPSPSKYSPTGRSKAFYNS